MMVLTDSHFLVLVSNSSFN